MPSLSRSLEQALHRAIKLASDRHHEYATLEHLLLALMDDSDAGQVMKACNVDMDALKKSVQKYVDEELMTLVIEDGEGEKTNKQGTEALEAYCVNLNEKAKAGRIDPLIGREAEVERTVQILCRRQKNNPLFVGDPGVGKTAIAEGLARKIVKSDVPEV